MSKREKIRWIVENFFTHPETVFHELKEYWYEDKGKQEAFDNISENTISNFHLPYSVAPNFLINGKTYAIPMVIEESSVVAAASSAAKYWMTRGGFKVTILGTTKVGNVHFTWKGKYKRLKSVFKDLEKVLHEESAMITANMRRRKGGVKTVELIDLTHLMDDYYQLKVTFETVDSMGANFINSVLENFAATLVNFVKNREDFSPKEKQIDIIMSILSNYTPESLVRAEVSCKIEDLGNTSDMDAQGLAERFYKAVKIAHLDPYRATTHNKGIFNGVDAVVLATSNDFRAIEACGHTYASRDGQYKSLSYCTIDDGIFKFWLDLPMAIGTVGGLTKLHPLARRSLELLGNPSARELMQIIAAAGLAQNFAAIRSLVTTGIQKGHMKMHLTNILNHFNASEAEAKAVKKYFADKAVSFSLVREFLESNRQKEKPSNG